jgi:uncharacterized membrane protein
MMSAALQIVTMIETLFLVCCFAGIVFHTLRTTGRASKAVLLLIVLVSWQAWAIPIGILCFPVVAAVLFVVGCCGRVIASVYNRFNDHANACQTRAERRALRKSLQKLRKKGLKAERQAENTHRKYWIAFLVIDVVGVYVQVMSLICFLVVLRALILIAIFVGTVLVCGFIVRCFSVIWPPAVWIQTSCRLLQMRRCPVEAVVARFPVLGLACYTPLVESMLRTCLWCVLLRGCALGDVAATGTCILWMLALHGSTAASCRAFSMLVMLGLDERSFSLEGKVLLCAVVAVAPLFPPRKAPADYMRQVRDFKAQHGFSPSETRGGAGVALARCIRKARAQGVFNAAELAELDSEIPAPAAAQKKPAGAVAAAARVAQPRSAPTKTTPAGSAISSALGGSSLGSGARSSSDIARPSDPLIVEAADPQVPDPEIDGGELVLDDPPPSRSNPEIERQDIFGHRSDNTSSATGQEAGGSTTSDAGLGATLSRASTGKRGAPASQESAASAAAPKTKKRSKIPEVSLREGLFFDPQQGAWCGMHALNNYCLNGRLVQQQDCRDAARLVASRLTDARAGDVEPISNHLDPLTGWLSIDVINVLGQANLGLHVEAARVSWPDALWRQQDGAALVNWNKRHWTVLQRDPSGDGWMHTNSIEGVGPRYQSWESLHDKNLTKQNQILTNLNLLWSQFGPWRGWVGGPAFRLGCKVRAMLRS